MKLILLKFLKRLLSSLTSVWKQKRKKITIDTSEGSREINDNMLKIGKEETRLSPPPFFTTGHYFVHLKHVPKIIPCFLNRKDNTIYADGLFKGVVHEKVCDDSDCLFAEYDRNN